MSSGRNEAQGMSMLDRTPFLRAVTLSPFRSDLENKYGSFIFDRMGTQIKTGSYAHEEMAREAELTSRYQQLKAMIRVEYKGKSSSESELRALFTSPSREERIESRKAVCRTFLEKKDEFASILTELVSLRNTIALKNGYSDYLEYMDDVYCRTAYGEAELDSFVSEVKAEILPIIRDINSETCRKLGLDELMTYDADVFFPDGNATPKGDAKFLTDAAKRMYDSLDPEFSSFFRAMSESGSLDVAPAPHKVAGMGFCTNLKRGMLPFVFGNMNGTDDDVIVFTHEIGHSWQGYLSDKKLSLNMQRETPLDSVEIPSKTMELFAYAYADEFFQEDAGKFRYSHFRGAVKEIAHYCSCHEMNTWIYTHVGASFDEIVKAARKIEKEYSCGLSGGELDEYTDNGANLIRNMGVYMFPRYLISYSLSEMCALDLFALMEKDREACMKTYNALCSSCAGKSYPDVLDAAGLKFAYTPGRVKSTAAFIRDYLKNH
ncbi:MAG: M3 family metallopeptidase [Bullifex sp.]